MKLHKNFHFFFCKYFPQNSNCFLTLYNIVVSVKTFVYLSDLPVCSVIFINILGLTRNLYITLKFTITCCVLNMEYVAFVVHLQWCSKKGATSCTKTVVFKQLLSSKTGITWFCKIHIITWTCYSGKKQSFEVVASKKKDSIINSAVIPHQVVNILWIQWLFMQSEGLDEPQTLQCCALTCPEKKRNALHQTTKFYVSTICHHQFFKEWTWPKQWFSEDPGILIPVKSYFCM